MDTGLSGDAVDRSPFYDGRTTYGGRAAYQRYTHVAPSPYKVYLIF